MSSPLPGGAGDAFLTQLLGDLASLVSGAPGDRLELATQLAQAVAAGGRPEPNADPLERIRFEELLRVAELHVAELTGLSPGADGATLSVETVPAGTWARRTVEDWGFVLDAMVAAGAGPEPPADPPQTAEPGDGAEALARLVAGMAPMLAALQLGSAIGHLARTTLGQYEIPLPRPSHRLLVVPGNVTSFASEWSLDPDDVRLWVCLREVTAHGVLAQPHVRRRLTRLVGEVVGGTAGEAAGVLEQLQHLDPRDPDTLHRLLGDPGSLLNTEPSPEHQRAAAELGAVVGALLGYVEHVLDVAGTRLLGGRGALAEAWRRRQVDRPSPSRTAEMLFGLDLGPAEVDRGVAFVSGVLERAGEEGLARLWASEATLPTPAEIAAPGLWLERISFEEPPPSARAAGPAA